jgi:hypothetical protein
METRLKSELDFYVLILFTWALCLKGQRHYKGCGRGEKHIWLPLNVNDLSTCHALHCGNIPFVFEKRVCGNYKAYSNKPVIVLTAFQWQVSKPARSLVAMFLCRFYLKTRVFSFCVSVCRLVCASVNIVGYSMDRKFQSRSSVWRREPRQMSHRTSWSSG